jgi:glycosyltransferase involved in cell wall biosynthesis
MKLSIVIPALNEEEAIGNTIERCQKAVFEIETHTIITEVQIVVVSDGSTDKTVEIAKRFTGIELIIFEKNRGYGAAIKAGWELAQGDYLAFLDADGTCDPRYFKQMCQTIEAENADVVIGSRMGKKSKMPTVRRFGNILFALLLKFLSKKQLTDSASGMRVVRKASLNQLLPLPDGLHFTPAMSARVLMDQRLKIVEIDMEYEERVGNSKLRLLKDGVRFLWIILSTALYIRPSSLSVPISLVVSMFGLMVAASPIHYYIKDGVILESMIYRFIVLFLLGSTVISILCFTVIAEHTIALTLLRYNRTIPLEQSWWSPSKMRIFLITSGLLSVFAFFLILPGIKPFLLTGQVEQETLHWSRVMFAGFLFLDFVQLILTAISIKIIDSLNTRQAFLLYQNYNDN